MKILSTFCRLLRPLELIEMQNSLFIDSARSLWQLPKWKRSVTSGFQKTTVSNTKHKCFMKRDGSNLLIENFMTKIKMQLFLY